MRNTVAKQTTSASPTHPAPRRAAARPNMTEARRRAPSLLTFFQESRAELRKVTWPTREQTLNLTGAVIAMTAGLAIFLGLVDYILNLIVKPLIGAH